MKKEENLLIRVQACGLSSGYDGKTVIRETDFTVHAGEILVLIGPNGAGKSTLLKSIAGQLRLQAGTLLLCGKDMKQLSPSERARKMSVLLTEKPRGELMTCREVAAAGRYPYTGRMGILTAADLDKVDRVLDRLGASGLAELPFDGISDGQRQRVLLARALCQEPEVLVLDEPASYLDIRYQLELVHTLRSLAMEEKLTVIMSLHELDLVRRCADRIMCVKDGRADRFGSVEEIFSGDYLERLFDLPAGSLAFPAAPAAGSYGAAPAAGLSGAASAAGSYGAVPEEPGSDNALSLPRPDPAGTSGFRHYIRAGGKNLRCGYTTGTCAALAASGAARRLLTGYWTDTAALTTPGGIRVRVPLENRFPPDDMRKDPYASCGVRKDAGDDVDVTAGLLICAMVRCAEEPGILIKAGEGIGRVTKPGLDQPVGAAAINSTPRRMITEAVEAVCREADYQGGLIVTISVPGGARAAEKTFNPQLGIEGGISILGTSGIVEPMSRQALVDTITLELRQRYEEGNRRVILVPGNYGMDFLHTQGLDDREIPIVKCSNYIGEALDELSVSGFEQSLLAGHIGKLVKLAGGIMNTHSAQADCRRELFAVHAALAGADRRILEGLMECVSTDACIELLDEAGLREAVLKRLVAAIQEHISRRTGPRCEIGVMVFSNRYGLLGMSPTARKLSDEWRSGCAE